MRLAPTLFKAAPWRSTLKRVKFPAQLFRSYFIFPAHSCSLPIFDNPWVRDPNVSLPLFATVHSVLHLILYNRMSAMPGTFIRFCLIATSLLVLSSCQKKEVDEPTLVSQTVTVSQSVTAGSTLEYILPVNQSGQNPTISSQARNFSTSQLAQNEDGQWVYQYSPSEGFTGTEEVIIDSYTPKGRPDHHGKHRHHGAIPFLGHHRHHHCGEHVGDTLWQHKISITVMPSEGS